MFHHHHHGLLQCIKPKTESFVLDAEAVAWDKDENKILPFQELSKRKRKDVKAEDIKVKVHIFAFDLLYLNGEVSVFLDNTFEICPPDKGHYRD